jgi:hypothetical protein
MRSATCWLFNPWATSSEAARSVSVRLCHPVTGLLTDCVPWRRPGPNRDVPCRPARIATGASTPAPTSRQSRRSSAACRITSPAMSRAMSWQDASAATAGSSPNSVTWPGSPSLRARRRAGGILWIAIGASRRDRDRGTVLLDWVLGELAADGVSVVTAKDAGLLGWLTRPTGPRWRSGSTEGSSRSIPSIRCPAGSRATRRQSRSLPCIPPGGPAAE